MILERATKLNLRDKRHDGLEQTIVDGLPGRQTKRRE